MSRELSITELQAYLKQAIELETDVATQKEIISQYQKQSEEKKPILEMQPLPAEPVRLECQNGGQMIFLAVSMLTVLIALACLGSAFLLLGSFFILPPAIAIGAKGIQMQTEYQDNETQYNNQMANYRHLCDTVKKTNQKNKEAFPENLKMWQDTNAEMDAFMEKPLEATEQLLEKYYSNDFIYPKYRNLPALTSIYEYLITGRCEGLTGPHGAYNLYEDELRKDTVISQLSVVIQNLEQIKQNQYMLYQQVKSVQKTVNAVICELQQIKGYTIRISQLTALNTYYAALNERNSRITMWSNV